jgi:hypothetical protein
MSNLKQLCPNMTKANKYISSIINSFNEGELIENIYISELVKYHPTKEIDIYKLDWFKMKKRQPFNKLALFYKYNRNEKEDDISWKLCIRNLYGKYNRDTEYDNDVKMAFRNESHIGSKKQYFIDNTHITNDEFIGKCNNCKITTLKITTDHYLVPYKKIFDTFIKDNNITLHNIDIFENDQFEIRLKDNELSYKWLTYHDNEANYRLLCSSCNSHFGCYGYK